MEPDRFILSSIGRNLHLVTISRGIRLWPTVIKVRHQLTRGYDHTHHSQVDDYDHVVPRDVAQAATILAVNAWQLADMPSMLPRGRKGQ